MSYSINASTDDCYEGTSCLVNKFGIRDDEKLSSLEAQITFAKTAVLETNPIVGSFDFDHYKKYTNFCFRTYMSGQDVLGLLKYRKNALILLSQASSGRRQTEFFQKLKMVYLKNVPQKSLLRKLLDFIMM